MPRSQPIGPMAAKGRKSWRRQWSGPQPGNVTFRHLYDVAWPIKKKIETIATKMYGARPSRSSGSGTRHRVGAAVRTDRLPICMAKTPLSLSHDPALKGPADPGLRCRSRRCECSQGLGFSQRSVQAFNSCRGCQRSRQGNALESIRARARLWGCPRRLALLKISEEF